MPQTHDYYEILEVVADADLVLIKSQYRKLVRANHPDIAPDKDVAHDRMQLILEAYNILSDVEKREAYDRARQNRQESARRPVSPPTQRPPSGVRVAARPGGRQSGPASYANRDGSRTGSRTSNEPASAATNPRTRLLTMVFDAANLYYEDGQPQAAISICERVMKADASNAEAPALLGDIYADQGRIDLAMMNYERAVRRQPHNLLYQQKWNALKTSGGAAVGSTASSQNRVPIKTKSGGCGAKMFLWTCIMLTAVTPILFFYYFQ